MISEVKLDSVSKEDPLNNENDESSTSINDQDKEDIEEEPDEDYQVGGYHPVNLGDVFNARYYTLRKLGWGHFATVWLAFDTKQKIFTAVKIPKSRDDYIEAAKDEYEICRELRIAGTSHLGAKNVVQMLNVFDFYGVDDCLHFCMAFEVLGDNLLTLLRKFNTLNLCFIKVIAKQLLQGLSFIHDKCSIIHTDIKPENVVISLTEKQVHQLAIDAYNYHDFDEELKPKSMISSSSKEFRNKYYLNIPLNARKRIRRNRRKHREKVKTFLKSVDTTALLQTNDNNQSEVHDGFGDQSAHSHGDDLNNSQEYHPVSSYYEELQAGNPVFLNQCQIKIVDFGNACFTNEHLSEEIQTREYRAPEVIIGTDYDTSADIWSAACVIFELAAGDYLFYPEVEEDQHYDSDDDHIAKIIEVLGPLPLKTYREGKRYNDFFDNRGNLHRIPKLAPASLLTVITELAELSENEALEMTEFLKPMLHLNNRHRAKAAACLRSTWLKLDETCDSKLKRRDNNELV